MSYRTVPTQLRALEIGLQWHARNVTEEGGNNRGPVVELMQRADSLPGEGYAWCQTALNFFHRLATGGKIVNNEVVDGEMLLGGTASVGFACAEARKRGQIVTRPLKGDRFAMQLNNDSWPDHTGQIIAVVQVVSGGYKCLTLEGNTGDSSIGDGDSLAIKTRVLYSAKTIFYRDPSTVTYKLPPLPGAEKARLRNWILLQRKKGVSWQEIKQHRFFKRFVKLGGK